MEINTGNLAYSEAAARNQGPILEVLAGHLPDQGEVLEVGSGTGQHIVAFARAHPHLTWQPSDQPGTLATIRARVESADLPNLREPIGLDVTGDWPEQEFQMIYSANTLHIMPWPAGQCFLSMAAQHLPTGGALCIYGPFIDPETPTADSNRAFDQSLRARDPAMGVRGIDRVNRIAVDNGLEPVADHAMPANNRLLVWRRT